VLSGCGEVISSLPDPNEGDDDGGSGPLLAPVLQSFTIEGMRTGDVLLSPNNSRDSVDITTITVAATRATLEVRLARLLPSGTLASEVRCDVLPLTLNTVGSASEQTFTWRVAGLPNGVYRFRVQLSDDIGNNSQTQSSVSVVRIGFPSNRPCPLAP
jgi:hypothetical protein